MEAIKKSITIKNAKFWTNALGVIFCELSNTENYKILEVDLVKKYEQAIFTLSEGRSMPFVIDIRDNQGNISIDAAKLLANSSILKKIRISEAFIINSINAKLLINSYKRIYEPNTPFKIFKDFDEALAYSVNTKKLHDASN
ncbi:MAG: hypothetical protein ABJM36_10835 [Algibacter sp.]|uniref:DUF7793 family protein n=1 Tax=Algibacter sp. TaxID=1872428 RepID=UPI003298E5E9